MLPPNHLACSSTIEQYPKPESHEQLAYNPGWVGAWEKKLML